MQSGLLMTLGRDRGVEGVVSCDLAYANLSVLGPCVEQHFEQEFVGGHGTWDLVLQPTLLRDFFKPQCDK